MSIIRSCLTSQYSHKVCHLRPISDYINMLSDIGFYIRKIYQLEEHFEKIESEQEQFNALYPNIIVLKAINISNEL